MSEPAPHYDTGQTAEALWRTHYALQALDRQMHQGIVRSLLLQQALSEIAADYTVGAISISAASARMEREAIRISTMFLRLSFPLEERMN